jgi:uncharacterized membrane protein YphA (DoxX/SURF4 family)
VVWAAATVWGLIGIWSERAPPPKDGPNVEGFLSLAPAFGAWGVATAFLFLAGWKRLRDGPDGRDPILEPLVLAVWVVATAFLFFGLFRFLQEPEGPSGFLSFTWAHGNWDDNAVVLDAILAIWIVATALLLVGLWTRPVAVVVWLLSTSFACANPYADNAGDQMRGIMLFYLMLCPCGAAWSVDRWWARRRGAPAGPVYVSPWALRLLFVQMTFTYFCNGVFKIFGKTWREGYSLYYVLNDLTLTRWSYAQLRGPDWLNQVMFWLTRVMSWTVLVWELTFPLFMMLPWWYAGLANWLGALRSKVTLFVVRFLRRVRVVILLFGVAFHVGIFLSLELGGFGPYMICLYLPLVPWERWVGRARPTATR